MTIHAQKSHVELRDADVLELTIATGTFPRLSIPGLLLFVLFLSSAGCWIGICWAAAWGASELFQSGEWAWGSVVAAVGAGMLLFVGYVILRGKCSAGLWFHFDRRNRRVSRLQRPLGFWREPRPVESWNLDDVEAIDLRYGGLVNVRHSSVVEVGRGEVTYWTTTHHTYEFNLLSSADSSGSAPTTLLTTCDWEWMRELGPQIGAFIGLPVHDHLQHSDTSDG